MLVIREALMQGRGIGGIPEVSDENVATYFKRFSRKHASDLESPTIRQIYAAEPDEEPVSLAEVQYFSNNLAGSRDDDSDINDSIIEASEMCYFEIENGRKIVWIPYIISAGDSIPKMLVAVMDHSNTVFGVKMGIPGDTCMLSLNRKEFAPKASPGIVPQLTLALGKKTRKICAESCTYRFWDAYPNLNMNIQVLALLVVGFALSPKVEYIGVLEDAAGVPCSTPIPREWNLPVSQEMISYKKILESLRTCKEPTGCFEKALQKSYYARWGFMPLPHSVDAIVKIQDVLSEPLAAATEALPAIQQGILRSVGNRCTIGDVLNDVCDADESTKCLMRFAAYSRLEKEARIYHLVLSRSNLAALQNMLTSRGGHRRTRRRTHRRTRSTRRTTTRRRHRRSRT